MSYESVIILGYGRSGKAAEKLLLREGTTVRVFDESSNSFADLQAALANSSFDICIVSPGFALDHDWVVAVSQAGISLLSELELGWSRHAGRTIAVTGSNGKSTAVKWIVEMLLLSGASAEIGGNYGIPACEVVLEKSDLDWLVLEVSSFQLETVRNFRADVAVLLNLLPNHLNRHGTMEVYRQTKARILSKSKSDDVCIAPLNLLADVKNDAPTAKGQWITFGNVDADYCYSDGKIWKHDEVTLDLSRTLFDNPVLGSCTGAAVMAVANACGVDRKFIENSAKEFVALPHRLQRVAEIDGVVFINDSKATNLAAIRTALLACGKRVHLLAGGQSKESDFTFMKEILAEHTERIYLIGQASRAMYLAWNKVCSCVECGTLEQAFQRARRAAVKGDVILLSPGCASFDQFASFEDRGERFIKLVLGDTGDGEA